MEGWQRIKLDVFRRTIERKLKYAIKMKRWEHIGHLATTYSWLHAETDEEVFEELKRGPLGFYIRDVLTDNGLYKANSGRRRT